MISDGYILLATWLLFIAPIIKWWVKVVWGSNDSRMGKIIDQLEEAV